ncbi:cytochrome P450 [Streptomyces cacaoi]|uniref:cytochrome P450 n=1 Tax=Streptomyces cacaoi TaxID=1898 RepID=UPI003326CAC5
MPIEPAPAPGGLPVLGHAPRMLRDRLAFLQSLPELGPAATVRLGRERVVVLNDHRLVRDVLTARSGDFGLSPHFRVMKRIIGDGLLATDGAFHRRRRSQLMPALHRSRLRDHAETMSQLSDFTAERLAHLAGLTAPAVPAGSAARTGTTGRTGRTGPTGRVPAARYAGVLGPFEADRALMALSTEIVTRCLFSSGVSTEQVRRVTEAVPVLMEWAGSRSMDPTSLLARVPAVASPLNRRFRTAMRTLDSLVGTLVADRLRDAPPPGTRRPGGDLLDAMLGATDTATGERLTAREAHDETMSFLVAGIESVSRTLTWALHLLARNPRARRRLYEEVDTVLDGRAARWEDIPRLPYTRCVLSESMRLYPPGYLVSRSAVRDTALRADGLGELPLRAGQMVMFSYYVLQRNGALFPDPHAFRPERWEPAGDGGGNAVCGAARDAYLPFGLGPHGCLGESFAWTEMTLVLASLAARWDLRAVRRWLPRAVAAFSLSFDDARMTAVPRRPAPARGPDRAHAGERAHGEPRPYGDPRPHGVDPRTHGGECPYGEPRPYGGDRAHVPGPARAAARPHPAECLHGAGRVAAPAPPPRP